MLCISQNGGSWFGLDNRPQLSNSSAVGNGEEAFETGENMGGAV